MKRTNLWLTIALLCLSATLSAQTISFGYDEAGNRISRTITLKSTEANIDPIQLEEKRYFDVLHQMKITISPNPHGGKFTVAVQNLPDVEEGQSIQLMLHSISGEMIYHIDELQSHNEVDISNRQNGTYLLTLISANDKRTWKIIKN